MRDIVRAILELGDSEIEIEGSSISEHTGGRPSRFVSRAYVDHETSTLVLVAFDYIQIPLEIIDDEFAFLREGDDCAFVYRIEAIFATAKLRVW